MYEGKPHAVSGNDSTSNVVLQMLVGHARGVEEHAFCSVAEQNTIACGGHTQYNTGQS